MQAIKVTFDNDSIAWIVDLRSHLSALEKIVHKPVNLLQLIRDLPRSTASFNFEFVATGAGEGRIVLEPSDRYLHLMTALRAFDGRIHSI